MTVEAGPECTLGHKAEILAIVERMKHERALTTIEFGSGHAIVSTVLDVRRDRDALVFDVARDGEQNRLMFASRSLTFMTELDRIQISFATGAASLVTLADGPAAVVDLPRSVVRLQRRAWFRAALPVEPPVRCTLLDDDGNTVTGHAIDLSEGGAAVIVDDRPGCRSTPGSDRELVLSLPDIGRLELDTTLRTVEPVAGIGGARDVPRVRIGLRFESLPAMTANRIQRYVQQVEVKQLRLLKRRE